MITKPRLTSIVAIVLLLISAFTSFIILGFYQVDCKASRLHRAWLCQGFNLEPALRLEELAYSASTSDTHIEEGVRPPTRKEVKNRTYSVEWRASRHSVVPVSTEAAQPRLYRRGDVPVARHPFDLNTEPELSGDSSSNQQDVRNDEQATTSRRFDADRLTHQDVVHTFHEPSAGVILPSSTGQGHQDRRIIPTAVSQPTRLTLAKGKMKVDDSKNSLAMRGNREDWKYHKMMERMGRRRELPEEAQSAYDLRSQIISTARSEREEFEKANPDKKGDYAAWKRFKNAFLKRRRRQFLKGDLDEEERQGYEERRRLYSHPGKELKTVVTKTKSTNKVMRDIANDLQHIIGIEQRKAFIAKAFQDANLPIPSDEKLAEKEKNSRMYVDRREKKRVAKKGSLEASSSRSNAGKSIDTSFAPTKRDVEVMLQKRAKIRLDLNELPKASTSPSGEKTSRMNDAEVQSSLSVHPFEGRVQPDLTRSLSDYNRAANLLEATPTDEHLHVKNADRKRFRQLQYRKAVLREANKLDSTTQLLYDARSAIMMQAKRERKELIEESKARGGEEAATAALKQLKRAKSREKKRRQRAYRRRPLTAEESDKAQQLRELFERDGDPVRMHADAAAIDALWEQHQQARDLSFFESMSTSKSKTKKGKGAVE